MSGQAAERDLQAEADHAEWLGWEEAQGYEQEHDDWREMRREAFHAGLEAARALDRQHLLAARARLARIWRESPDRLARDEADAGLAELTAAGVE